MTTTPTFFRGEQQANTSDAGPGGDDQREIQLVGLTDGTFIALWEDNSDVTDGDDGTDIIGQRYDAEGNKIGGEFQANNIRVLDDEGDFTAAALPDGNFLIVYEDTDANGTSIVFDIKSPTGGQVDSGVILNDPGADILGDPSVTVAADGSFLVTYQRDVGATVNTEVVKVSAAGVAGAPVVAIGGSDSGFETDTTTLTNGNFVVVSRFGAADDAIAFRIVDAAGVPQGGAAFVANTGSNGNTDSAPTVTALAGGGFVVAWQNTDASDTDLQFQIFDANGATVGAVQGVNGGAVTDNNNEAELIGLPDGGFVIAYDDDEADTVVLQRYDATGAAVGTEVTVTDSNIETTPTVTLTDDGRLLVGWTTALGANSDVEFAILDPRESLINGDGTSETITSRQDGATVNGLGGNDTLLGQGAADTLNGGAGGDTLLGRGGDDTFELSAGETNGDVIDGGAGSDRIVALSSTNVLNATVSSIEELEFGNQDANPKIVSVDAAQIGAGLGEDLVVDGNASGTVDTLRILMGADTDLDLSAFTFQDFDTGGTENDRVLVIGDNDAETIIGSSVRDEINGNGGNDTLAGGGDVDALRGGLGNDSYNVNAGGEAIEAANQGIDTVRSVVNYTLGANVERLQLLGGANLNGVGNTLDNRLTGNTGGNVLNGLQGDDLLTGDAGADRFLFTTALNAATNVDVITDFQAGADQIRLDNAVFAGLPVGLLGADAFVVGAVAADAEDRVIYNNATGAVFFDADGAGGAAQTLFARLDPGLAVTATDFFVF